jgi:4a-hydroxytetrahydrobiopterin dehydratase
VPNLWFQDTDEHETPRQRFHLDVYVAPEVATQRIAAALAAGGVVVDDSEAPSYTVIADQDGNRACVCTSLPAAQQE